MRSDGCGKTSAQRLDLSGDKVTSGFPQHVIIRGKLASLGS